MTACRTWAGPRKALAKLDRPTPARRTARPQPFLKPAQPSARDSADLDWLEGWCGTLRGHGKAGRSVRRARIVSEPLSEYQRWSYSIAWPMVEAGEDIRWVPRRLLSPVALPGNDFYLFDNSLAVFLLYSGNGLGAGMESSADPAVLRLCRTAFDAAWALSVPHREYAAV